METGKQLILKYKKIFTYLFGISVCILLIIITLMFRLDYNCGAEYTVSTCKIGNAEATLFDRFVGIWPEKWQVFFGNKLSFLLGDAARQPDTKTLADISLREYSAMSTEWNNTPSALSHTYLHWMQFNTAPSHYFAVQTRPNKKVSQVVIFLHGYAGNFQIYTSKLQSVFSADSDTNQLLVAPSYKSGAWQNDSVQFIDEVLEDLSFKFNIDQSIPFNVIGLSNGGLIVPELLTNSKFKERIVSANLFSTYVSPSDAKLLAEASTDLSLCYTFGTDDQRIDSLNSLENIHGMNIKVKAYTHYGHELFFATDDLQAFSCTMQQTEGLTP